MSPHPTSTLLTGNVVTLNGLPNAATKNASALSTPGLYKTLTFIQNAFNMNGNGYPYQKTRTYNQTSEADKFHKTKKNYNPIKVILRPICEPFPDKAYTVCKGGDNIVCSYYA
jgi:hypothetical protein